MAKQVGEIKITGTIDNVCFYKMGEDYFARLKSCLTGKRFWRDKAFKRSRKSCSRFGKGNTIASKAYQSVDEKHRVYKLFCFLRSTAIGLLKRGMEVAEVEAALAGYLDVIKFKEFAESL